MSKPIRDVQRLYKKLDHVEHILHRPDRHLGSTRERTIKTWLFNPLNASEGLRWAEVTYRPALLKMFDEIITNSVDFSKTPEGSNLTRIDVKVNRFTGAISVEDNGGIPVVKFEGYEGGLLPDMLFGELYSSSNFNEDDADLANETGAGQNGEGASLVNVFSKNFTVVTCDGTNRYSRTWRCNMSREASLPAEIKRYKGAKGTSITFIPDYPRFGLECLTADDAAMIVRRAYEIAACNSKLSVSINGQEIRMNHFRDFSLMFGCDAVEETDDWKVGIFKSDSFQHHSYVNSAHTWQGGPHVEYVLDKIIEAARPKLKRAYKVDYKPGVIRGVIGLVLTCNVKTPRFDSQTKETMTTKVSEFGTRWEPSARFLDKAAQAIAKWMGDYHDTLVEKAEEAALDETEKELKKVKHHHIPKYEGATSQKRELCTLYLTEGDSAAKPILAARDTKLQGVFPLKGKILNVLTASRQDLLASVEIQAIISIMGGLKVRGGVDFKELRYQDIVISTDADADGAHIRGLVCAAFMRLWPEFIRQGRLKYLVTPVVVAKKGKDRVEFFEERDFENHIKATNTKYDRIKYLKGLGSNDSEVFRDYLNNKDRYQRTFEYDDDADRMMDLAFNGKRADDRKPLFEQLVMTSIDDE